MHIALNIWVKKGGGRFRDAEKKGARGGRESGDRSGRLPSEELKGLMHVNSKSPRTIEG